MPRILRSRRMEMAPRKRVELGALVKRLDQLVQFLVAPRDQNVVLVAQHALHDAHNVLGRLAARKDDFRKSLAQRAVVVDARIADIFKRKIAQAVNGVSTQSFPLRTCLSIAVISSACHALPHPIHPWTELIVIFAAPHVRRKNQGQHPPRERSAPARLLSIANGPEPGPP